MFVNAININQPYNNKYISRIGHHVSNTNERKYTGYSSYPVLRISFHAQLPKYIPTKLERFEGCLFGGALGDAFGAPLEKHPMKYIEQKFHGKLYHLLKNRDNIAEFTDDTQMVMFTIEGMMKAFLKYSDKNPLYYQEILKSYNNWYKTQTEEYQISNKFRGIMDIPELYRRKEPGDTCLSAIKTGLYGTTDNPINNSAGNGGVMRVAPVGLLYKNDADKAFDIAKNIAALTHGNPNGYLPAGFFASLISNIAQGNELNEAIQKSINIIKKYQNNEQIISKIKLAQDLSKKDISETDAIKQIGAGWTGDEALSIAIYSNLKHNKEFKKTIVTAANHDGDSDTTAAIAGNISGLLCGINQIPNSWKNSIEMKNLLSHYSQSLSILSDTVPSMVIR